ncbi:MAG: diaminopimelate epimerase [Gammaproteobacteria bacterium]|nr:diaminopimelate epimerase [Gammaproteobacteria bacterium]MDH3506078.1 diaminopimelate epimerase [Gammaproteobacteria bacterium]
MQLQFTKMHGAGNDFMLLTWPTGTLLPEPALIRRWADRRRGVGFDQLLLLAEDHDPDVDAEYRIFNADGNEVEQCGNGVRCIAAFISNGSDRESLKLASPSGLVEARLLGGGEVSVSLGEPRFTPDAVFLVDEQEADRYRLAIGGRDVEFGAVSLGNPHAVIAVDSVDSAPVGILGEAFQSQPVFPNGVNVGFMEVLERDRIRLRVFERGVGETLACGTGAAAAAVVGQRWGRLDASVHVELPGGTLGVDWQGPGNPVWLSGLTTRVYEGRLTL